MAARALKFTHKSDIKLVVELQRKVFHQKVTTLEKFDCNWLRVHDVEDLVELASQLAAVQDFELRAAYVARPQQLALANAVATRPALHTVKIVSINLRLRAVEVLAGAPQLCTLWLNGCSAIAVADAMAHHSALQEVKLQGNDIRDGGAMALAKALDRNHVMDELHLDLNHIGSPGAVALAESLSCNGRLRHLGMRGNPIGAQGARALRGLRIVVVSERLLLSVDTSCWGWMCCVLIRFFGVILFTLLLLPWRCFVWQQRAVHCISAGRIQWATTARYRVVSDYDNSSVASFDD